MKFTTTKGFFLGALLAPLGVGALSGETLTTFQAGTPIRAAEVNANFNALQLGLDAKQSKITGSPCQAGQFIRGVGVDGALSCAPDQLGAVGGAAGVSSLNGKTGSLALEAGGNIQIDSSQAGKLIVSSTATGGGVRGVGVRGTGPIAMQAQGNAVQNAGAGGWAKAMVVLNPDGTVARCYNGVTGNASGVCGFSSARTDRGRYTVNFGFDISQRFYSANGVPGGQNVWSAFIAGINGANLSITLQSGGSPTSFSSLEDGSFSLIVF